MKKLMHGSTELGVCGMSTDLFDSGTGEPLYVGDLVLVWYDEPNEEGRVPNGWHAIPEYVVWNQDKDCPEIWGVAAACIKRELVFDGEVISTEIFPTSCSRRYESLSEEKDFDHVYDDCVYPGSTTTWHISKIKDWTKTVDGEAWGGVSTVVVD